MSSCCGFCWTPTIRGAHKPHLPSRVEPSPFWFWYWYGYTMYRPNPTYKPKVDVPAQSGKPPTIPGAEFAKNIARHWENFKQLCSQLRKIRQFHSSCQAASKPPACPQQSRLRCACAACACACACVSCACACAGGGVG